VDLPFPTAFIIFIFFNFCNCSCAVLFGIDKAKEAIRKNNFSILVEGQMDLILSHQAGFKNTVASSGTAMADSILSKENIINNLGLITRLSKNIVLAYDADKAGVNASNRFAKIALSLGMDVKVADMREGMDPADLISKVGVDVWREAIRNSKHFIEFMLARILKDTQNDRRKAGRKIKERLLPFVNDLESSIEKSHFIGLISNKSGIFENALIEDLRRVEVELKHEREDTKIAIENVEKKLRKDYIERKLLGIALWKKDKKLEKTLAGLLEKYKDSENDLIFEAEVFYGNSENLEKDKKELLANLEEERINEELLRKMQELRIIKGKDEEMKLLAEIQELNKQKHEKKK